MAMLENIALIKKKINSSIPSTYFIIVPKAVKLLIILITLFSMRKNY